MLDALPPQDLALRATISIVAIGTAITSLESLYLQRDFRAGGIFCWRILQTRSLIEAKGPIARLLDHLMQGPVFTGLVASEGAAAIGLLFTGSCNACSLAVLTLIVLSLLIRHSRAPYGLDGSDQMSLLLFVSLWLRSIQPSNPWVGELCLWFIGLQSCLAYGSAGVAKLFSATWRRGEAVAMITKTECYGLSSFADALERHPLLSRSITWGVVAFECTFPAALFLGSRGCIIFLSLGLMFHLANAAVMGLNSFVWSFTATYPAIAYCSARVQWTLHRAW